MDVPMVAAAWLEGNIANWDALSGEHVQITLAAEMISEGRVFFADGENIEIGSHNDQLLFDLPRQGFYAHKWSRAF